MANKGQLKTRIRVPSWQAVSDKEGSHSEVLSIRCRFANVVYCVILSPGSAFLRQLIVSRFAVMTDRNWAAFLELEERALKNLQGHKHCFGEDGRLAEGEYSTTLSWQILTAATGVKGEIHNRFEKLSHEERKKLTDAIQRWMDSIFAKDRSDEAAETVKDYTGSPGDDDVHGEIDESRATLEDYLDAHKQRLGSTKEARDATAELMRVRGEEEDAVTEYIKKMLEDHDTTIRDLEELLNQVDDLKGSARRKLERRRRIALGLPGEQWHYMKKLGTGSYGRAGVYVKLDETGTIVDVSVSVTHLHSEC